MTDLKSALTLNAVMVAAEFIDRYMAAANGEYVKVYLYLLRHQERDVTVTEIADALNHTETDVRRALAYWKRQGVLWDGEQPEAPDSPAQVLRRTEGNDTERRSAGPAVRDESAAALLPSEKAADPAVRKETRPRCTAEQMAGLAEEEEFTQLLYISQKYMNKVFTPRECEVFAYLYSQLGMSAELLEYLVEYCVQGGHCSIRYLETVALSWHEKGVQTAAQARQQMEAFTSEAFGVMKAFGLSDRRPGNSEMAMIRRWFHEWGFSKELVMEACGRTLRATHKPSFSYADKILSGWQSAGVRTMEDVARQDEKRESRKPSGTGQPAKPAANQFHNFRQRDTDYDSMVLERLKERLGEKQAQ